MLSLTGQPFILRRKVIKQGQCQKRINTVTSLKCFQTISTPNKTVFKYLNTVIQRVKVVTTICNINYNRFYLLMQITD